jgi:hypothetical protein
MTYSCAGSKPNIRAAFYSFEYNEESYRIRSVSSKDNSIFFNELIGNEFVAKDYDQDRFIDEITHGKMSLSDAQKIYDYAISNLTMQKKLHEVSSKLDVYLHVNTEYDYEIKSFHPSDADPFNEIKIINKGRLLNPPITIWIDQKADGIIDGKVKGAMSLEKSQSIYSDVIKNGLKNNKLIEVDNMILVNTK